MWGKILSHLFLGSMNSMTSAVPVANSVLVVAPHNGYPVTPGIMSQVPLYPNSQPQVHLVPGNPPSLVSNVNGQPVQKALKEGKTLGVSEISLCRPQTAQLEWWQGEGKAWEIHKHYIPQVGLSWSRLAKHRSIRKLSCTTSQGASAQTLYFLI